MTGTEEQFAAFDKECSLSEGLMATTLAKRISGMKPEESIPFIVDWFKAVRHMAIARHLMSGIVAEITETMDSVGSVEDRVPKHVRMEGLVRLLSKEFGLKPTDEQLAVIWQLVNGPDPVCDRP
jgi:hypothetical protein